MSWDSSSIRAELLDHGAVGDDLVAGTQRDDVAVDHLAGRDGLLAAVADCARMRGDQEREPVERPLGADVLEDADARVGDDHDAEQAVGGPARGDDHRPRTRPG